MEVYEVHFPAPKMIHVSQERCKACYSWWILIGMLLIMDMDFFHLGGWRTVESPRKQRWVVKTDLLTCKRQRYLGVILVSPAKTNIQMSFTFIVLHQLPEKAIPDFWLRRRAVLPFSTLWMKKKKKWNGSVNWENNLMVGKSSLLVIGCWVLPKSQQDRILSSREERSLTIIDSLPFTRRGPKMWSISVD